MPLAMFGQILTDSMRLNNNGNKESKNASVTTPIGQYKVKKEEEICNNPDEGASFIGGEIALKII
jgi:hypothetical protein